MGLLSNIGAKIQQAKSRGRISSILCGRSWLVISNDVSTNTYLFKPDGQLLITRDGIISPVRWDFRSENDTLLITDECGAGIAFSVNIIKENVLISLVRINTSDGLFLSNESVPNSPRSFEDVDKVFVEVVIQKIKRLIENYVNSNKDLKYYESITKELESKFPDRKTDFRRLLNRNTPAFRKALDSLLEHIHGEMLVNIIDIARKEFVDIENEIVCIKEKQKSENNKRIKANLKEPAINDEDFIPRLLDRGPDSLFDSISRVQYSNKIEEYVNTNRPQ